MNSAIERLLSLRVEDVMSRDVTTVSEYETLSEVANRLNQRGFSAAPVVDSQGHLIGIITASDYMRYQQMATMTDPLSPCGHILKRGEGDAPFAIEEITATTVVHHMSKSIQAIAPDATLVDAARMMCGAHIHRIPVVDVRGRVIGMLSTLDIVSALIKAIEE